MLIPTLVSVLIPIGIYICIGFIISVVLRRNDVADIMWGPGIALVAWSAIGFDILSVSILQQVVTTLITIWAVRLGVRIFLKNYKKGEDQRYRRWREAWGMWFYPRSFIQVFVLQGTLMVLVGYSAIHAAAFAPVLGLTPWLYVGIAVWLVGFVFEVVGDYQLDRFLNNPDNKGRLMKYGLWRYTRHPNYFGEVTMWWGIWICVSPAYLSVLAFLSPLTITILILFVSGIPLLEASLKKHPEFAAYARTTNAFIPWPPRTT